MLPETREREISKLKDAYNSALGNIPDNEKLIDSEREAQKVEYVRDKVKIFTTRAEKLLNDILSDKKEAKRKRLSILYPSRSSASPLSKDNGLKQENNALLFLNQSQSADVIVQKLKTAIDLDEYDFASTIFDKILMQLPKTADEETKLKRNPEKYYLVKETKALFDSFSEKTGLSKIETKIKEFNRLETKASNLLSLVTAGENFVFFPEDYSKMNSAEQMKVKQFIPTLPTQTAVKLQNMLR